MGLSLVPPGRGNGIGLYSRPDGRTLIVCRDGSRVYYYRAVVEAALRRHLRRGEVVHHRNGDPSDDRLENLALTTQPAHNRIHGYSWRHSRWFDRTCRGCGCDHDERTPGCRHCRQRHAWRARNWATV